MTTKYVLGSEDEELTRLGRQHQIWAPHVTALWERAGLGSGMSILDAGCGPGFASVDLSALVGPSGRVVAIDESQRFVEYLTARAAALGISNIDVRAGNLAAMTLPEAEFDAVFLRWVLCFVPSPERIVARLAAALKPGGRIIAVDYFNYHGVRMVPGGEIFDQLFRVFSATNRAAGGDYDVGNRFAAMAHDAGLNVTHLASINEIARPGERYWEWFVEFCQVYAPKLVSHGGLSAEQLRMLFAALDEHQRTPGAFLFTPPVIEMIAVRQ